MDNSITPFETSDDLLWLIPMVEGVFQIEDVTTGALGGVATRLRGRFLIDPDRAYEILAPQLSARGRTLILRREQGRDALFCLRWVNKPAPNNIWVPVALAVATVFSILATYLFLYGMTELTWQSAWANLGPALQFTAALVAILLSHEMGHYIAARRFGLNVTPPYLIPFPLSPFGTMGAIIRMKDIPPNRRAMLITGAAGPLAGLVVTLPILIVGLMLSEVRPLPTEGSYIIEGNSLLYGLLKYLIHGQWLPSATHDLFMHPLAFAGWAGLLVTSFNLMPAGQLDGGHVAFAWLGAKARYLTWAVVIGLAGLSLVWPGWLLWALLILLFARSQQEPLNGLSSLKRGEVALAVGMLLLFMLTFTPMPLRFIQ